MTSPARRALRSRRHFVAIGAALGVLVPGLLAPGAVAAVAELPAVSGTDADLVVPARYPANPPLIDQVHATDLLVAYTTESVDPVPQGYGATTVRVFGTAEAQRYPAVVPAGAAGRYVLLRPVRFFEGPRHRLLDALTGSIRPLPDLDPSAIVAPLPDGGWIQASRLGEVDNELVVHGPDDAVRSRMPIGRDGVAGLRADAQGAVWVSRQRDGAVVSRYAEFASGAVRTLADASGCGPALTRDALGWCEGSSIVRVRRSDFGVTSRRTVARDITNLRITPTGTAWVVSGRASQPGNPTPYTVFTSSESDPARHTAVAADLQLQYDKVADAGDELLLAAGATSRTRGLYRLPVGASQPGEAVDLVGPSAPLTMRVGLGRLVVGDRTATNGDPDGRLVEVELVRDATGTTLGPERTLLTGVLPTVAAVSPGLVASRAHVGSAVDLVIGDHRGEALRRPRSLSATAVSGARAVLAGGAADDPLPASRVIDLRPAAQPDVVVDGAADLWGDELAWVGRDGAVRVRDLARADGDRLLRSAGLPQGAALLRRGEVTIGVREGWVLWSLRPAGAPAETVVRRLDGTREHRLPSSVDEVHLSAGRVAWVDSGDRGVHVLDLETGVEEVVGTRADRDLQPTASIGVSEDAVAWTVDDGRTVVRPLPLTGGAPAALGQLAPRRFSPGSGLVVRVDATRPLDQVELVVRDATGREVARRTSTAPTGGVRAAWDGRLADGSRAPDGSYSWSLSANGPSGVLQPAAAAPLRGTAVLDSIVPSLGVVIPLLASDGSPTPRARLTWSTGDPTARFDILVQSRVPTADPSGPYQWSPRFYWRRDVAAGTAVYETGGSPFRLHPGTVLRFTVRVSDEAGNARSAVRGLTVPYDDRASLLQLSSGWTRAASAGAWAGTVTEATAVGRTIRLRSITNRVAVVGARCPGCGRFSVFIDGRLVRTVDTGGRDAVRQRLVDITLPGAPALHTVQIRTEGTAGRPRVRLDAVALVR